jgi:colicin import membrane protein
MKAAEAAEKERAKAEAAEKAAESARKDAVARAKAAREAAEKARAEVARKNAEIAAQLAATRRIAAEREAAKFAVQKQSVETARKAAAKASEREITFDFEGVAKHLKNENQVRVFREFCTGAGVTPYLAVNQQAALAKRLVELAGERKAELSGAFIKNEAMALLLNVKTQQRELSKKEQVELARRNQELQARNLQEEFARNCRSLMSIGTRLADLEKKWPKDLAFPITGEFRNAVRGAKKVIDTLNQRI